VRIQILDEAEKDLQDGREFYDRQEPGVGDYFAAALAADIDSLILFAGIHPMRFGFHRALSKRFPFGVYYLAEDAVIRIYAVLDLRRDPAWIRRRLTTGER
jgi:plasmid stabilization system protein ParE